MTLTELGREFGIVGTKAGAIAKEFLISNGVKVKDFNNPLIIDDDRIRKQTEKLPGKSSSFDQSPGRIY